MKRRRIEKLSLFAGLSRHYQNHVTYYTTSATITRPLLITYLVD